MFTKKNQNPNTFTGNFKEFFSFFFPLALVNGSNYLLLFVEKIFLGYFSVNALEAAISAAYVCQIFQGPCVALVMMGQVYVGRCCGAQEWAKIGPGIWQFIWFSVFSMLITIPASLIYGEFYFTDPSIRDEVLPYYYFLVAINFLFPLGMALSCYYLGQGKTLLVFSVTFGAKVLKLILAYFLIFGVDGILSPQGLMGGAFSTFVSQAGLCLIFLVCFLKSRNAQLFQNRVWKFEGSLFWHSVYPGVFRALNRVLNFASWAAIAYLMSSKGGDHLLVLSVGGALFIFLPFLGDAICQAQLTIVSHIIGARNYHFLKAPLRSGMVLSGLFIAVALIPLVIFPLPTYELLFPDTVLSEESVRAIFYGVWLSFAFYTISFVPIGYGLAYKDTGFSLFMGAMNWVNGFLLMYFFVDQIQIAPNQFWLTLSLMHGSSFACYYLRMLWLNKKEKFVLAENSI